MHSATCKTLIFYIPLSSLTFYILLQKRPSSATRALPPAARSSCFASPALSVRRSTARVTRHPAYTVSCITSIFPATYVALEIFLSCFPSENIRISPRRNITLVPTPKRSISTVHSSCSALAYKKVPRTPLNGPVNTST